MWIALTGDVMLGRLVDEQVVRNQALPPKTVWGDVLPVLLQADLRLINLECVVSAHGRPWRPQTKAFHFRAHPRAIDVLQAARVDCVTLANNHVLDYGHGGLAECLQLLERAGIRHTGSGTNLDEAASPALLGGPTARVAVLALTDNEPEWAASHSKAGIHYVEYDATGLVEPHRTRVARVLAQARRQAQLVIVSAHVGPNWGEPSPAIRALAHHLLALGADVYWGHSNHTPRGIEIINGKVILYSTGDFVDDYAVDPEERNDLSFLFLIDTDGGQVRAVHLRPVAIHDCRVRLARGLEVSFLNERMGRYCAALGTAVGFHAGVVTVSVG
jgi:poly-gamma-glutamate synthesis protein (capsule biosynthesis protein)